MGFENIETLPNIQELQQALNELDIEYNSTYTTPESLEALAKTFKTFNITIKDWNTLIEYISTVGSTLGALYKVTPELAKAIAGTYKDAVTAGFTITNVVVNVKED